MQGAAIIQNAGDQPSVASRQGKGVRPNSTMPQASQVAAASVRTSCEGVNPKRTVWRMVDSGGNGEAILRGRRLTDWDEGFARKLQR